MDAGLLNEIIEELRGTCQTLDQVLNRYGLEFEDLTRDNTETIDDAIFLCDECGWWCEVSEMSATEQTCTDCVEEEE